MVCLVIISDERKDVPISPKLDRQLSSKWYHWIAIDHSFQVIPHTWQNFGTCYFRYLTQLHYKPTTGVRVSAGVLRV
jgi:hypothetical protein